MTLPPDFIFSQNNLQAFVDCPRRFELAFIEHTRWPAPQAEPVQEHERRMQLGARFHQMVFQHLQGLPVDLISSSVTDTEASQWWQNYLKDAPSDLPDWRRAEYELSMPFAGRRLMARFDLLALEKGRRGVIVDWKTSFSRPSPPVLAGRVQTRLYPFILASSAPLAQPIQPETVTMIYWFPNYPRQPVTFNYDSEKFERDRLFLSDLVETIDNIPPGGFALTTDPRACRFCRFRSLCGRGDTAGQMDEMGDEFETGGSLFDGIDPYQLDGIAF